jgi:Nuclease-related domain
VAGKLMKLKRADVCPDCGTDVPTGTEAYWLSVERVVRCVGCYAAAGDTCDGDRRPSVVADASQLSEASAGPPAAAIIDRRADVAGGSAQREHDKRAARELAKKQQKVDEDAEWRSAIRAKRPVLGRIATTLTPKPQIGPESQATEAWKLGAQGERRVAEVLEEVAGIEVLHDRRVPGTVANIDHIVVGPSGVFVVDAKKYTGRVEARDVGRLFRVDERLYVNGRDRTKLVDGVRGQVDVVRTALGEEFADVEVRGLLCFVGCEWGMIKRPKRVKGVVALWPLALPEHVSTAGDLGDRVIAVTKTLSPATSTGNVGEEKLVGDQCHRTPAMRRISTPSRTLTSLGQKPRFRHRRWGVVDVVRRGRGECRS